jgi:threonine/homoserine/homoserine lactone efflux protein
MAPGPVAAATIMTGTRNRWAGSLIAVGHGIVEFPLMILIMFGAAELLKSDKTKAGIGIIGGIVLLLMAIQMFIGSKDKQNAQKEISKDRPVFIGFILSATNPYFLVWWATIGLTLVTSAKALGVWAFALFTIVHWFCDIVWLTILSWTSFKGFSLLGAGREKIIIKICAAVMFFFGLYFIYKAQAVYTA